MVIKQTMHNIHSFSMFTFIFLLNLTIYIQLQTVLSISIFLYSLFFTFYFYFLSISPILFFNSSNLFISILYIYIYYFYLSIVFFIFLLKIISLLHILCPTALFIPCAIISFILSTKSSTSFGVTAKLNFEGSNIAFINLYLSSFDASLSSLNSSN